MNEPLPSRLRPLADPAHLPALKPDYVHRQPALGLGPLDPADAEELAGAWVDGALTELAKVHPMRQELGHGS